MNKWSVLAVLAGASLLVFSLGTFFSASPPPLEMLPITKGNDYALKWGKVEGFENKGLTKSAHEEVNAI